MKIPKTFLPENNDLDKKVQELAQEEYKQNINLEERAFLEERLQENYLGELKEKRKNWKVGDHLNMPDTNKISSKRFVFNSAMMLASVAGSVYLFSELREQIPSYLQFPSVFAFMLGLPAVTYKTIAEVMIRYDTRKKYKGKR